MKNSVLTFTEKAVLKDSVDKILIVNFTNHYNPYFILVNMLFGATL